MFSSQGAMEYKKILQQYAVLSYYTKISHSKVMIKKPKQKRLLKTCNYQGIART